VESAGDDESLSPGKWGRKLGMCALERKDLDRDNMCVLSCLKGLSPGRGIRTGKCYSKEQTVNQGQLPERSLSMTEASMIILITFRYLTLEKMNELCYPRLLPTLTISYFVN
jgi:hypothetical protein